MECSSCNVCLLISTITCILQLLQGQISAHSLFRNHQYPLEVPTNVTKHLYFPNFSTNSEGIKLLGSAKMLENEGFIQIPDPSPSMKLTTYQAGRALYSSPVRLFHPPTKTPASFQTTFSFQFKTIATTNYSTTKGPGGNGLAFVMVPDEFTVDIANCHHAKVFAVEFGDNIDDPNNDHNVGINGSFVSIKATNITSATTNVSFHDDSVHHRAWIMYDGGKRWIDIYLGLDGYPLPPFPLLSSPLNLSPFLKEYMFVGFSASTGDLKQIHRIHSWNFSSSVKAVVSSHPRHHVCKRNVGRQVSQSHPPSSFTIFLCVVGLSTISSLSLYYSGKRHWRNQSPSAIAIREKKQRPVPPTKPRRFTMSEVYIATRRFSKSEIMGTDSRGVIYRGTMANGRYVTVKRFSTRTKTRTDFNSSRLDRNQILKRIYAMTNFHDHPRLAMIRGWCFENGESILVYDYFQNGTLDRWLFGVGVLSWARRLQVIKDIAEALSFLHSKQLFHGNLNTRSVFIDIDCRAVLGDYGFIFIKPSTIARMKADVFMFGVLVLETIAGKRKVEEGQRDLLGFAWEVQERWKIIDQRMEMESCVKVEQAVRVVEIGLSCTSIELNRRPSMEEVVLLLQHAESGSL